MSKILAVFMDGTWNEPNDMTNVYDLYKTALEASDHQTYYVPGVGTSGKGLWAAFDKLMGGAFGAGLSSNIQEGYRWICERYRDGDRIFLFGFSRGAYTARSLAGLIRKSGLVRDPSDEQIKQAYQLYRDSEIQPDDAAAITFREKWAIEAPIEFVGVWDTVGELGIPVGGVPFPGFSSFYKFHDTSLSDTVRNAYHAIAANEYRSLYEPTLWTVVPGKPMRTLPVEQRWFTGAHADVGGGYPGGLLQTRPAQWIQSRAAALGMRFAPLITVDAAYAQAEPHDSYAMFKEKFPLVPMEAKPRVWVAGQPLNMTLDPSIRERLNVHSAFLANYPAYRSALMSLPDGD